MTREHLCRWLLAATVLIGAILAIALLTGWLG